MRGMTALDLVTLVTALGCALVAGVFFAFSSFVMAGLARLSASEGVAAMQSINRTVITASFMLAWLGSGVLCVAVAAWSVAVAGGYDAAALGAAAIYVAGSVGVTFAANVPLNDRLDAVDPATADAAAAWRVFLRRWTAWNHMRVAASLTAAAVLTTALVQG
jgi:uncharacterized membrane protein